jgi:hypothetical protein
MLLGLTLFLVESTGKMGIGLNHPTDCFTYRSGNSLRAMVYSPTADPHTVLQPSRRQPTTHAAAVTPSAVEAPDSSRVRCPIIAAINDR